MDREQNPVFGVVQSASWIAECIDGELLELGWEYFGIYVGSGVVTA